MTLPLLILTMIFFFVFGFLTGKNQTMRKFKKIFKCDSHYCWKDDPCEVCRFLK